MKTLFPEMDKEIRDDRRAARRELRQHARQLLATHEKAVAWIANYLLEHGPTNDHSMALEALNEEYVFEAGMDRLAELFAVLLALHCVGKVWKRSLGTHPGSGQPCYMWGLRKVHSLNSSIERT